MILQFTFRAMANSNALLFLAILALKIFSQTIKASSTFRGHVKVYHDDRSGCSTSYKYSYNKCNNERPDKWPILWKKCKVTPYGRAQSPINIETHKVTYGNDYPKLGYERPHTSVHGTLQNNGQSATFTVHRHGKSNGHILKNVPELCNKRYVFQEFHFHIGSKVAGSKCHDYVPSNRYMPGGSEHAIDGHFYEGELHLVHWLKKNARSTMCESANPDRHRDGLVALAIFFQVAGHHEPVNVEVDTLLTQVVSKLTDLEAQEMTTVNLQNMLPEDGLFYTYEGTKTTPECSGNVRFVVFTTPILISYQGYLNLQKLQVAESPGNVTLSEYGNRRPLQSSKGVDILANFQYYNSYGHPIVHSGL